MGVRGLVEVLASVHHFQACNRPPAACCPLLQNSSVGGYNTRGFVEVLAASQSAFSKSWFQGTADAVRQYMWLFDEAVRDGAEEFLILSGGCRLWQV